MKQISLLQMIKKKKGVIFYIFGLHRNPENLDCSYSDETTVIRKEGEVIT